MPRKDPPSTVCDRNPAVTSIGGSASERVRTGWGGWIRTNTVCINSAASYQLDHAPVAFAEKRELLFYRVSQSDSLLRTASVRTACRRAFARVTSHQSRASHSSLATRHCFSSTLPLRFCGVSVGCGSAWVERGSGEELSRPSPQSPFRDSQPTLPRCFFKCKCYATLHLPCFQSLARPSSWRRICKFSPPSQNFPTSAPARGRAETTGPRQGWSSVIAGTFHGPPITAEKMHASFHEPPANRIAGLYRRERFLDHTARCPLN